MTADQEPGRGPGQDRIAQAASAPKGRRSKSVDPEEVAKFSALAEEWWDPHGKFRPLHRLNPTRLSYIRDRVATHFGRDPLGPEPLAGLTCLDIGCGGGLLAEPLTRLGAKVTAIDASEENVRVAAHHAENQGLKIRYLACTAEELAAKGVSFDVVINMEVVEHVADVDSFLDASVRLVAYNGVTTLATLNRTPKSFLLAIVGAEYLLRWLPRGTHDWRRFLKPSELVRGLRDRGLEARDLVGVSYNPLNDRWVRSRDTEVNYMIFAVKNGKTLRTDKKAPRRRALKSSPWAPRDTLNLNALFL